MGLIRRLTSGVPAGLAKLLRAVAATAAELIKLAREMLVIPAQLWLLAAEILGGAVLRVWLGVIVPTLRAAWSLLLTAYYWSTHHVSPRRAVAGVALAAVAALVVSQWLDYRAVSVGTPLYEGEVSEVAPAPDVTRDQAGEAHAWVMLPIAALGAVGVLLAAGGRRRAAWLAVAAGLGAVAIAVGIDAPKGLDEGAAAVTYEGAEAQLLEGFWAQIASGAALAGTALMLFAYGRRERAPAKRRAARRTPPGDSRSAARKSGALESRAQGGPA